MDERNKMQEVFIPEYLVNEQFGDRYFDVVNAVDEAQQIYFTHNNLIERIASCVREKKSFVIGETGFGAGRVVVSLVEYLEKSGLQKVEIEYHSVELYPMSPERMKDILEGFRERLGQGIDALVEAYGTVDTTQSGWHVMRLPQSFGMLIVNLWIGEALEMVESAGKAL